MAHFNIDLLDQRSNGSLAAAYGANTANLNSLGETNPLRTSGSQSPTASLTSYSVSEMLQGSATYRPQGFAYDAYNQTISSDLGYLIRSEGGENQLLAGRTGLLAQDILRKEGFNDGIFSGESQWAGPTAGGQTPSQVSDDIPNAPASEVPVSGAIEDVLAWAEAREGTPYSQCGARGAQDAPCDTATKQPTHDDPTPGGRFGMGHFDCSGFVTSCFFFGMGLQLPATVTYSMLDNQAMMATQVSAADRQPGDVWLHPEHVGFYYGDGIILDAGTPGVTKRNGDSWMPNWNGQPSIYLRLQNLGR